jgi:hypothetical protein
VTREELAREIAERNDRCGHVSDEHICLRPRDHAGEHKPEPIDQVVPF